MRNFRYAGSCGTRGGTARVCTVILIAWMLGPSPAPAACLPNADPAIRALQVLVDQDANAALSKVQALLDAEAGAGADPHRLASLYSVQAQAFSILERESDARSAVFKGLKFAPDNTD